MTGGDLSAVLVDLSGLQFGNALISALGCRIARGAVHGHRFRFAPWLMDTRTMLLDTNEANVTGKGTINFRDESLNYQLRTEAKHFSIGSLPAPINITGHLKSPSIMPDPATMAARGAAAVGLGVLLTPLAALLPTIQLGLGEDNNCGALIRSAEKTPNPAEQPTTTR